MDPLREKVKTLLQEKTISAFLGMKQDHDHAIPFLFTSPEGVESLIIGDARYPMAKIFPKIAHKYPDHHLGIMVRGCDEKALIELYRNHQLERSQVIPLGVACSGELAQKCNCPTPYPSQCIVGEAQERPFDRSALDTIESLSLEERFTYWTNQFGKCIKCYGCRNICPVCFCEVCTLEDKPLIPLGEIPPQVPSFHLSRAFHMAGRCIDCGLCEEGCPVDIPLRTLYRKVREVVKDLFDFLPGEEKEEEPPLHTLGDGTFELK
jgi:ferredoxin